MPYIEHNGRKLLYLHVPKTGGGTIESWLGTLAPLHFHTVGVPVAMRCTPQHLRMTDFRELFGEKYFDHVFMTVRHPYDRIASEFRMRAMISGQGFWKAYSSFSLWLETNLTTAASNPFHLDNYVRPQWNFHGSGVTILKYEDGLPTAVARIAEALDVPAPDALPRVHDTGSSNIEVTFDEIDKLRIQEFYRRDFEIFGYDV